VRTLAVTVATVAGVGNVPFASGTFGSLVAVPLLPLLAGLRGVSAAAYAAVLVAIIVVAVWSAGAAEEALGGHDHSRIVIDEVAGLVVAGIFFPATWLAVGGVRPLPPVRRREAVSRRADRRARRGGLGVVGDDLVAGLYAGLATWLVLRLV
jgi:phosphatidylglycerophosphatase A